VALLSACGVSDESAPVDGVIIEPLEPTATLPFDLPPTQPAGSTQSPVPTQAPAANGSSIHGFTYPIAGSCLPKSDQLMPNAARSYRNGIHEGVDFYQVDNCTAIGNGTPVLSVFAGRVVRADTGYVDPTQAEINAYLANPNTEDSLDKFRGRQVWVDHGGSIVTRYAHLAGVAPGITVGTMVTQGQLIAYVGESGTPESVSNPGREYHLHFEIRVGASYLGKDLPAAEVRRIYLAAFSP
jgi:murein DD-endopeptidase MepM/ murein hydrolase activator NlpD